MANPRSHQAIRRQRLDGVWQDQLVVCKGGAAAAVQVERLGAGDGCWQADGGPSARVASISKRSVGVSHRNAIASALAWIQAQPTVAEGGLITAQRN
jgi:hypothetical protein